MVPDMRCAVLVLKKNCRVLAAIVAINIGLQAFMFIALNIALYMVIYK